MREARAWLHALALGVLATYEVTWAFRGNHDDIYILGRNDRFVENAEAVRKEKCLALRKVWFDVLLVSRRLLGIWNSDHDYVCQADSLIGVVNLEARFLGDVAALGFRVKADDDIASAFLKVESVGVALGTEAENGKGFPFEKLKVGVFVGVDFGWHVCLLVLK